MRKEAASLSIPLNGRRSLRPPTVIGRSHRQRKRVAMKIAYVVWLENLGSPILTGQVVEVLEEMGRKSPGFRIILLAFQPLYRIIFRRNQVAAVRSRLRASGIEVKIVPCLAIPQIDLLRARWYTMPLIIIQSLPALLVFTLLQRIDILHCRSYAPAWAASILKDLLPARMVFDPRSDFPEENVTAGKWSAGSLTDRAWRRLERRLLQKADATIAITDSYVEHFRRVSHEARFHLVPNNVDTARFGRDIAFRETFRQTHGLGKHTLVFCYNGSMGTHWNSPVPYADFILRLRDLDIPHWFLFVTPDTGAVERAMKERQLSPEEYGIVSCGFDEVPKYLSVADIGTMFVTQARIALGIKSVECLAAGLPMIVNEKVAGAAEVVTKYGVGLVVAEARAADLAAIRNLAAKKEEMYHACRQLAEARFSTTRVAEGYLQLYGSLALQQLQNG